MTIENFAQRDFSDYETTLVENKSKWREEKWDHQGITVNTSRFELMIPRHASIFETTDVFFSSSN